MTSPTNRWKLGLFVLSTSMTALLTLVWLGARRLDRETLETYYFFDEAVSGLELGAPVKFRGVTLGKVTSIRAASDQRHVAVKAEIFLSALEDLGLSNDDRPSGPEEGPFVPDDLRAQLMSSLLTGTSFIQSDFVDLERYPIPTYPFDVPWETVHTIPSTGQALETGLVNVLEQLPDVLGEATQLLNSVRSEVEGGALRDLLSDGQRVFVTLQDRLDHMDELPLLERGAAAVEEARLLLSDLRLALQELRGEAGPIAALTNQVNEVGSAVREAGQSIVGAGDAVRGTLESNQLSGATRDLRSTLAEIETLGRDLRGSLPRIFDAFTAIGELAELLERDPSALLYGRGASELPDPK